ncbi:ATP-binding protein [Mesorhizobium sp. M0959]
MKERKNADKSTLDQMQVLGLAGMAGVWCELAEQSSANELSRDEWLGLMLDREVAMCADKRVRNRLASAKLRFPEACIEDIDFAAPRVTGATPWRSPRANG